MLFSQETWGLDHLEQAQMRVLEISLQAALFSGTLI